MENKKEINPLKESQSDEELKHFCRASGIKLDFIGLINQLDFNERGYYIINLLKNNNKVGHWVSLVRNSKHLYYFDPVGFPPDSIIIKYAKSQNIPLLVSKFQLQKVEESLCGFYCCLFLWLFQKLEPNNISSFKKLLQEVSQWEIKF